VKGIEELTIANAMELAAQRFAWGAMASSITLGSAPWPITPRGAP